MITGLILNISQQMSGINFLNFFSTDLFNKIANNGKQITFMMGIVKVLSASSGTYILNKFGRRPLLSNGCMVQCISFLVLYIMLKLDWDTYVVIPVGFYLIGFALGLGGTMMIYTTDILPANGIGLAVAVQWLFTSIVGKVTPIINKK